MPESLDDPLAQRLRLSHHRLRIDGLVRRDEDEAVGAELDRLTRKPLLRGSLHLMRGPARAAELGALQQFLECGFDTFKAMGGAGDFLRCVGDRDRALAAALFAGPPLPLGQLP